MVSYTGPADNLLAAYSYAGIVYDVTTDVDDAAVTGLRIKADVFYKLGAGTTWVKIGTKRQEKYIGTNVYRFNIEGYLQSILTFDLPSLSGHTIYRANNSICQFKVRFAEEYRDAEGIVREYASTETSPKFAINATRQIYQGQGIETTYLVKTGSATAKFLTDRPRVIKWRPGEKIHLSFVHNLLEGSATNVNCRVTITTTAGNSTFNIGRNYISVNDTFTRCAVHLDGLFADNGISATVRLVYGPTNIVVSETLTIVPDYQVYGEAVRMFWLNSLGGFDDYTFTADRSVKNKIKREEYKRQPSNSSRSRGYTSLNIVSNDEVTVYSQFESKDVIRNICGVFESPEVYIYENGLYIPINVENSGLEYEETNKIKQVKLTYTRAVEKLIQNG